MSAITSCCVKANFIKAAKENWVPCEVRLLSDDTDTFLCIKSRPLGFGQTEEDLKSIFSGSSTTGTTFSHSNNLHLQALTPVARAFTALCNLSEYKSCSVVTVSINDVGHFALKLIPAGIFGNKRLYLAMSSETEATMWMSMIKTNLGKRKKVSRNLLTQSRDSLVGTLRQSDSQDTLRGESGTNANSRYDLDIDTIDNEVYEPCSAQDLIPAVIQQRGDWEKLRLSKMDCFLRLTDDRLELLDHNGERVLHWFPYLLIRRFGAVGGVLRVDAGRRCSTGDGHFFFTCTPNNGQPVDAIVSQIRQLALEAKQRLRQEQAARQQMLQQHQQHSLNAETGPSGSAGLLLPPVPTKSSFDSGSARSLSKLGNRSPSPKSNFRVTTNSNNSSGSGGGGGGGGGWWTSGTFKRASSTPNRRQAEEALERVPPAKAGDAEAEEDEANQENPSSASVVDSAVASQKVAAKAVDENTGVFIASPAKATTAELTTNGLLKAAEPTTTKGEVQEATTNGRAHQLRLYDNVPVSRSGEQACGSDTLMTESWRLGSGLRPPRGHEKRFEDTNLPPPPVPPPASLMSRNHCNTTAVSNGPATDEGRSGGPVKYNGGAAVDSTPPPAAPKPFTQHSPKAIEPANYRQTTPEFSHCNWMTGMLSTHAGRPYREEMPAEAGEPRFSSGLLRSSLKSAGQKSLAFGSGVYESEERSPSHLARLNMRGLDEVLQELRDANQNVTSAVQAAERQRRSQGFSAPYHHKQQQQHQQLPPSQLNTLTRISSPTPAWSIKRDI